MRCRWEERGKETDKRGRLQECSGALDDGVMWRTKQGRWNPLVTFDDVLSVEASLCLCSGTQREESVSRVPGHIRTHTHTHSAHDLTQITKHAEHVCVTNYCIQCEGTKTTCECSHSFFLRYSSLPVFCTISDHHKNSSTEVSTRTNVALCCFISTVLNF